MGCLETKLDELLKEKLESSTDHHNPDSITLEMAIERAERAWDELRESGFNPEQYQEVL